MCVTSAEEAFSLYETCRETLKASAGSNYSRWVKETVQTLTTLRSYVKVVHIQKYAGQISQSVPSTECTAENLDLVPGFAQQLLTAPQKRIGQMHFTVHNDLYVTNKVSSFCILAHSFIFRMDEFSWHLFVFVLFSSPRCSSLFSLAAQWKLHPEEEEEEESELCSSRLQLFSLAGGASRTDLRGSVRYLCSVSYLFQEPVKNIIVLMCRLEKKNSGCSKLSATLLKRTDFQDSET